MIKDNRLNTIASLIDKNTNTLLDIGTDHGYLIKIAFQQNLIKKAIASDINKMPLATAQTNLKDYNVEFVISNGFENIKTKIDTVVIAGMGANLINKILDKAPEDKNITYILQANNKVEKLRQYLSDNNYLIIEEIIVKEKDYYYIVIKTIRGKNKLSFSEVYLGPIIKTKKSSLPYYENKLEHIKKLIKFGARESAFKEEIKLLEKTIKNLNR